MENHTNTAKTTSTFWGYEISKGEILNCSYALVGEYHLVGKRGAHYITWRRNTSERFQFINFKTRQFVAIHGNHFLAESDILSQTQVA